MGQSKILNAHHTNAAQRFFVDFLVEKVATEAQIDSGADVSIISENVVDLVHPDWKSAKSANPVSLSGVRGKSLAVIDRKILNISFSPDERETFPHPFSIVKQPDLLLLSSQAMYSKSLGIEWPESQGTPFLSWRDRRGKKQLNELSPEPKSITGKLNQDIQIVGLGEKLASFVAEKPICICMYIVVCHSFRTAKCASDT